jgi:uncharacterized membrane protein
MKSRLKKVSTVMTFAVVFAPKSLFACAACYGRSSSPLAYGINWGIFTLMGVIATVLVSIAVFFIYIIRRETAQNKTDARQEPQENPSRA